MMLRAKHGKGRKTAAVRHAVSPPIIPCHPIWNIITSVLMLYHALLVSHTMTYLIIRTGRSCVCIPDRVTRNKNCRPIYPSILVFCMCIQASQYEALLIVAQKRQMKGTDDLRWEMIYRMWHFAYRMPTDVKILLIIPGRWHNLWYCFIIYVCIHPHSVSV